MNKIVPISKKAKKTTVGSISSPRHTQARLLQLLLPRVLAQEQAQLNKLKHKVKLR
jgi:hypothetical protein